MTPEPMSEERLKEIAGTLKDLMDCDSLAVTGRVKKCEIGNFPVLASEDTAPVAYVADMLNAQFFASTPTVVRDLLAEVNRLGAENAELRKSDTGLRLQVETARAALDDAALERLAAMGGAK